jgi:signal peptidase I
VAASAKPMSSVPKLEQEIVSRRTEAQKLAARRLRIYEMFTSLWAPLTALGIVFLLYVVLVELSTCSYLWAQPLMKGFALLMVLAFGGLAVYRNLFPAKKKLRKLRREARELLQETELLLHRHRAKIDEKVRAKLVDAAAALDAVRLENDPGRLEAEVTRLSELSDKHLSTWRKGSVFDFAGGFVKALLIALAIRAVVIEPFKIPSGSMIPTLEIGDQIFVNKFIYGVRIPWMNTVPFQIVRAPKRGDVIVFNNPVEPDKDYIKRVIGIPGDTIEIHDKVLYINGQKQDVETESATYSYWDSGDDIDWSPIGSVLFREQLDGHPHLALRAQHDPSGNEGPFGPVPEDHVFVMGDNRDNSYDSRFGLGKKHLGVQYVPFGRIKGKAMVIWLALGHGGFLSGIPFFKGTGLRTDRLFEPVRMCGREPPRS